MPAKPLLALAAFSLAAAGTAASAQSAASLSIANAPIVQRQGAGLDDAAGMRGTILPVLLGALTIAILVFVVLELGDKNELPDSP